MIKVYGRRSTTLHVHKEHGAVASRMQEGGKEIITLGFFGFFVVVVSNYYARKGNLDLV